MAVCIVNSSNSSYMLYFVVKGQVKQKQNINNVLDHACDNIYPSFSHLFHSYGCITELIRQETSISISEASEIGNLRRDVRTDSALQIRSIFNLNNYR